MSNVKYFTNKLNEMTNTLNPSMFSNIGKLENLKVHDVYNYCNKNGFDYEFTPFYQDMYTYHFLEMLKNNSLEWIQYARTSSHYFNSEDIPLFNLYYPTTYDCSTRTEKEKMFMTIEEILSHLYNIQLEFNNNEITGINAWDIDSINDDYTRSELDDIIKELKESVIDTVNSINSGYEWLQDFKNNQVKNFNLWLGKEL